MDALAGLWKIASALLGFAAAWEWGSAFGRLVMPADWLRGSAEVAGFVALFAIVTAISILALVPLRLAVDGNTHPFVLWYAALPWRALAFVIYLALVMVVLMAWVPVVNAVWGGLGLVRPPKGGVLKVILFAVSLLPALVMMAPRIERKASRLIKRSIARTFLPLFHFLDTIGVGQGGSAGFARILDDWRYL